MTSQPQYNPKPECLACRTFFITNEFLAPNSPSHFDLIELPIKKPRQKIEMLRHICAFLASKGGHIYLGIEQKNMQVKGIPITSKQQDEFKFYIKQLVAKIHPKVDLSNREEVETVFIPVLSEGKEPLGKSVIKIIVKQGQRDRIYTYTEKVKISNPRGGEGEQFELRYGFIVDGNGYKRLEGVKLIDQISKKAKNEIEKHRFHQGCNPKPLDVDSSCKHISFRGYTTKADQNNLVNLLRVNLNQKDISFEQRYNDKDKVLILQFHSEADAALVHKLMKENTSVLKNFGIKLDFEGVEFNSYSYKRSSETVSSEDENRRDGKKVDKNTNILYAISNFSSRNRTQLLKSLREQLPQKFNFNYTKFNDYSIVLGVSDQDVRTVHTSLQRIPDLHRFANYSNGGRLNFGKITGHLKIYGVSEKRNEEYKKFVGDKFERKLSSMSYKRDREGKWYFDVVFDPKDVCEAMDKLIASNDKEFQSSKDVRLNYVLQCL